MGKGIMLSEKHGVNPSLLVCPVCYGDAGLALVGKLPEDKEAPRHMLSQKPCSSCASCLDQGGYIFIEASPDAKDPSGTKRTGRMVGLAKDAVEGELLKEGADVGHVMFMLPDMFENLFGEILREKSEGEEDGDKR